MIIKYLLVGVILSIFVPITVFATPEYTEVESSGENSCEVYANKPSYFSVIISKKISMDSTSNEGTYTVKIKGDIAGNEKIEIVPEPIVTFKQKGKVDVLGQVLQERTSFKIGDGFVTEDNIKEGIETEGKISVDNIGAGEWKGTFNFDIRFISDEKVSNEHKASFDCDKDTEYFFFAL